MAQENPGSKTSYRPPARLILSDSAHFVAFGGGAGLSPVMPGTMGTLVAVPLWWLMSWLPWPAYLVLTGILFVLGCWLCGRSAKRLGVHDHSGIVFDEIVGFLIAAFPLIHSVGWVSAHRWYWLLAAFVLFRVFDIVKPPPIRSIDRNMGGGVGIMVDDLIAGLFAAIPLALAAWVVNIL